MCKRDSVFGWRTEQNCSCTPGPGDQAVLPIPGLNSTFEARSPSRSVPHFLLATHTGETSDEATASKKVEEKDWDDRQDNCCHQTRDIERVVALKVV